MELKDFTELLKRDFPTVYNLVQRKGKSGLYLKPFINELQNYTDLVCKRQRLNCAATAYMNREGDLTTAVNDAPQPTIEDLINKTEEL